MIRTSAGSAGPAARFGVLGLTVILVLGGCSGSGEPNAEAAENGSGSPSASESSGPAESSTPFATPTPSASAYKPATAEGPAENVPLPVMPELAKEESKEGLREFAKHWYALVNYGLETGDMAPLEKISAPDCVVCMNVYDILSHGYVNEDWILGGYLEVLGTQSNYVLTSKNVYQVLIQMKQEPYEYRGPGNHIYKTSEGMEPTTVQMIEATHQDGHWFVHNNVTIK